MGALASDRKRGGDENFNFHFSHKNKTPYSNSLDIQPSKKPRFSSVNQSPVKAVLSSNNIVSRISRYPQAKFHPKHVHAPVRHSKFGLSASNPNQDSVNRYVGSSSRRLSNVKGQAFDDLMYYKKENGVIFVEDEEEKEKEVASDYFRVEEFEVIEKEKNNVEEKEKPVQPSSSSVVTELNNGSLRLEHALDILSSNRELSMGYDLETYKRLVENAERRIPKLKDLDFQIELNEKRRAGLQALRPEKKPEEVKFLLLS